MNGRPKKRWNLTISLILFVFVIMISALMLTRLIFIVLHSLGVLSFLEEANPERMNRAGLLGLIMEMTGFSSLLGITLLLGTTITAFFSKKALNPIRKVIEAMRRVSEGDFSVRVNLKGVYELEELSRSFNVMAHELSSIETLRRDFINTFSHEFKTPVVSVRGFAKLLKDGSLTEDERQEYLDIIITESERLAALSSNVLSLSKYENTEIVTDKVAFRLDEQIRRAVVMTEPKWSAKNINLNVEMDEIMFVGNEDLMQQVWLNLLDNAIKYSHVGGMIDIRLSASDGGILFSIQDDGIGMDEDVRARVFNKFYQGDISRNEVGNGLGLAIVKRIITLCGGTVEVVSEKGKGSTFIVTLAM